MSFPPEDEELFLPLHIAVSNKDLTGLKTLLEESQDSINLRDPWNYTPLQIAVQQNDLPAVQLLLSCGADSNLSVPDDYSELVDGTNSLSLAATYGHLKVLRLLGESSGRLTSKSLYMAAESGRLECVEFIISRFAKRDGTMFDDEVAKSEAFGEALRIAADGWRNDIVEVILRNFQIGSAFLDKALLGSIGDEDELDDLHLINPVPRKTPEGKEKRINTIKLLIDAGADVNVKGVLHWIKDMTLLHQAAQMGNRGRDIINLLLEKGPEINSANEDGQTSLLLAVLADDVFPAQKLIQNGAAIDHTDKAGRTAPHVSTGNLTTACKSIVTLLLDRGADISALTQNGETALHLAAHHGNAVAMEILIPPSQGLLLSARTLTGLTALHCAANGHLAQQCVDVVSLLLSDGADINEGTDDGYTLLHLAMIRNTLNKIDFISFLLENGADVNNHKSSEFSSRLAQRQEGNPGFAEAQIPSKAVVDTPLHLSLDVERAEFDIVYLLLNNGADLEIKDSVGRTALLRCVLGHEATPLRLEIAQELIKRGADIKAVNDLGRKFDVDIWCVEQSWGQC
ncbi:putative ankyrin repeat protein [Lachnellula suecica]|uniref:Putative ankyrin repeat protein n=1 Tax=Lachnellula suecica TaxID=602035 RepID=A0A8T9BVY0_9HELO|nr:putative ankyrin repeat protein [Lachnellula suecica]